MTSTPDSSQTVHLKHFRKPFLSVSVDAGVCQQPVVKSSKVNTMGKAEVWGVEWSLHSEIVLYISDSNKITEIIADLLNKQHFVPANANNNVVLTSNLGTVQVWFMNFVCPSENNTATSAIWAVESENRSL